MFPYETFELSACSTRIQLRNWNSCFIYLFILSNKILKWKFDILTPVAWFVFFWCLRQACLTLLDEEFVLNPLCLSSNLYQHLRRGLQSQPWYPYRLEKVHITSLKWATNHKKTNFFLHIYIIYNYWSRKCRNWGIKWLDVLCLTQWRLIPGCGQHPLAGTRPNH